MEIKKISIAEANFSVLVLVRWPCLRGQEVQKEEPLPGIDEVWVPILSWCCLWTDHVLAKDPGSS